MYVYIYDYVLKSCMYHSTDVPHVINRFFASVMQNPKRVPRFSSCAAMMLVLQAIVHWWCGMLSGDTGKGKT